MARPGEAASEATRNSGVKLHLTASGPLDFAEQLVPSYKSKQRFSGKKMISFVTKTLSAEEALEAERQMREQAQQERRQSPLAAMAFARVLEEGNAEPLYNAALWVDETMDAKSDRAAHQNEMIAPTVTG
jgi:hypothetical protein